MKEIVEIIVGGILGLMTVVEFMPVKLNPWKWLAKIIGRAINAEVITKVNSIENEMQKIKTATEEHAAKSCRVRILRFGDEIVHGVRHSKEHFDQILFDITEYENYCTSHPDFKNNITQITTSRIKAIYEDCLEYPEKFL